MPACRVARLHDRRIGLVIALCIAGATDATGTTAAAGGPPPAASDARPAVYVEGLDCVGGRHGLRLPADLRALKRLGPLQRIDAGAEQRWAEGHRTTELVLHFDGLALGVIAFSDDPARYRLWSAILTHPRWNRFSPFQIGRPVAEAAARLGAAAQADPGLARTYEDEGDRVRIESAGGIVRAVAYDCETG